MQEEAPPERQCSKGERNLPQGKGHSPSRRQDNRALRKWLHQQRQSLLYSAISLRIHFIQFIVAILQTAVTTTAPSKARLALCVIGPWLLRPSPTGISPSTKSNRFEFSVLACPHSEEDHHGRTGALKGPPKEVRRERMGVESGGNEMQEVNCKREIRDEFGPRNK